MRFTRALEAEIVAALESSRDSHIFLPAEAYRDDNNVLIHRDGTAMFLHRYLWKKLRPGDRLERSMFLLRDASVCMHDRCQNPWHRLRSTTSTIKAPKPKRIRPTTGKPTAAALNAAKQKCPAGHEYAPENTYRWKDGKGRTHRKCKTCTKDRARGRMAHQYEVGDVINLTVDECPPWAIPTDGRTLSSADHPELFAVIGTSYGEGYGDGTFNVPQILTERSVIVTTKSNGVTTP